MNNKSINDAVRMLKIKSIYLNDETIETLKFFVVDLYDIDLDQLDQMINAMEL